MTKINYPYRKAFNLAKQLKAFRVASESLVTSEINPQANEQMRNICRGISWDEFNNIIEALEMPYTLEKRRKNDYF